MYGTVLKVQFMAKLCFSGDIFSFSQCARVVLHLFHREFLHVQPHIQCAWERTGGLESSCVAILVDFPKKNHF